jgi:hypothetical protein
MLEGKLVAHLGHAAQSNEDATKFRDSKDPDPPRNFLKSWHRQKVTLHRENH